MRPTGVLAAVVASVLALGGATACTPQPSRQPSTTVEAAPAVAPPLTSGPATDVAGQSPVGNSPQERWRATILGNWRHASLDEVRAALSFEPRLPVYTGRATLQYLLTAERWNWRPPFFTALYSNGTLALAESRGTMPKPSRQHYPQDVSANTTVRGVPAFLRRTTVRSSRLPAGPLELVELLWEEDEVVYHLWYRGSIAQARRIAESIPR
jgi:hypothetical protein